MASYRNGDSLKPIPRAPVVDLCEGAVSGFGRAPALTGCNADMRLAPCLLLNLTTRQLLHWNAVTFITSKYVICACPQKISTRIEYWYTNVCAMVRNAGSVNRYHRMVARVGDAFILRHRLADEVAGARVERAYAVVLVPMMCSMRNL